MTKSLKSYLLLFICSVIIHQIATWKFGLAIFPDSINYVHAAKTLLSEGDFFQFTGEYFISWPPLYSMFLALFVLPFSEAAIPNFSIVHAILLGFTACFLFNLLVNSIQEKKNYSTWIAFLLALSMWPVSLLSFEIVSEVLFILLSLCAFYFAFKKDNWNLALLFISLAFLQRYIGFIWWIYIVLIGFTETNQKVKWLIKSSLSVIPISFWLFRNWLLSDTLTGERSDSFISLFDNLLLGLDISSKWMSPHFIPFWIRMILMGFILVLVLTVLLKSNRKSIGYHSSLFSVLYLIAIWFISTSGASEALSYRLLAPAYPFFMLSFWSSSHTFFKDSIQKSSSYFYLIFMFVACYQSLFLIRIVQDRFRYGSGGFARDEWKNSNTLSWYSSHRLQHRFIGSNASDAIYAHSGDVVPMSPFLNQSEELHNDSNQSGILIWFNRTHRKTLIPLDSLVKNWDLQNLENFDDGSVWEKK